MLSPNSKTPKDKKNTTASCKLLGLSQILAHSCRSCATYRLSMETCTLLIQQCCPIKRRLSKEIRNGRLDINLFFHCNAIITLHTSPVVSPQSELSPYSGAHVIALCTNLLGFTLLTVWLRFAVRRWQGLKSGIDDRILIPSFIRHTSPGFPTLRMSANNALPASISWALYQYPHSYVFPCEKGFAVDLLDSTAFLCPLLKKTSL